MKPMLVPLFAIAGGLTLSGITANLYRLSVRKSGGDEKTLTYYAVMAVAGPSVLFENATRSFRGKTCSGGAYAFALAIAGYWSFVLGLLVLSVGANLF